MCLLEKFVGFGEHGIDGVPLERRQFGALFPKSRNGGLVGGGDGRFVRFDERGRIFVEIVKTAKDMAVGPLFDGIREGTVLREAVCTGGQIVRELVDVVK